MLCDDREGWDGGVGWKEAQEGQGICVCKADSLFLQQKLTLHCKAIILQLKKIKGRERKKKELDAFHSMISKTNT